MKCQTLLLFEKNGQKDQRRFATKLSRMQKDACYCLLLLSLVIAILIFLSSLVELVLLQL
jgi:hypothetical protein